MVSIAAFVASEVTFVKEEIRDGETDDGFGATLLPDESTDSHPEMRVRCDPRSEGGTADLLVLFTATTCGLPLRLLLPFGFRVTVADEMIEFRLLPTMTEGGMMDGTVTRDGNIDSEGTESESDSLKSVVIDPDVAVESDFLDDFPLLMMLLLWLFLGDLDFLENIFMDTSKYNLREKNST